MAAQIWVYENYQPEEAGAGNQGSEDIERFPCYSAWHFYKLYSSEKPFLTDKETKAHKYVETYLSFWNGIWTHSERLQNLGSFHTLIKSN